MNNWQNNNPGYNTGDQSAGVTDVVTQLQGIVSQLTALVKAINGRNIYGSFTMPNASSLTITQTGIKSNSTITLTPLNAAAGTIMGSAVSLYISSIVAGTSFTVATASGGAAGSSTGQFAYTILTPT
jgi:hypothetical protein